MSHARNDRAVAGAAIAVLLASVPTARAEFIGIDPQGGFLRADGEYDMHGPLVIDLLARGYAAGDLLHLQVRGTHALTMFPDVDPFNSQDIFDFLGALFSSTDELLGPDPLHRVPGAIGTDQPPLHSDPTLMGGRPTDIDEDFQIADTVVRIPAFARFLFIGVPDIFYSDNRDPNRDFGFDLSIAEPAPMALLALCLGALLLAGRRPARIAAAGPSRAAR